MSVFEPDRQKPLSPTTEPRVWKVCIGISEFFLTDKELKIYMTAKQKGFSDCIFKDFALSTSYKYIVPNKLLLSEIAKKAEEENKRKTQEEIAKQYTDQERANVLEEMAKIRNKLFNKK